MTRFVRTTLSLLTALALTAAVAQGAGGMSGGMMMTPPAGGMGMGPSAGHAMTSAAVDELSFLQHMIPHHQEAIDSAAALLEVTRRPELRALLEDVIATQTAEVALMRGWIAEGYPGEPQEIAYAPMMRDLVGASVADRERVWLEDMVMHHMMAVHDARSLLVGGWATRPEVAQLAVDIIQGQMAEIHLMRGWLAAWFGGDATAMGRGGMGMGGMGMHGAHGAADRGPAPSDANAVEALARAFLAGAGGGDVVELHGPTVTFHVAVLVDGVERALVVDASTGEVRWDDER